MGSAVTQPHPQDQNKRVARDTIKSPDNNLSGELLHLQTPYPSRAIAVEFVSRISHPPCYYNGIMVANLGNGSS